MRKKKKTEYEYWRVPLTAMERQRLMVVAGLRGFRSIPDLLRALALEIIEKGEKNLFRNLDFSEQKQQE